MTLNDIDYQKLECIHVALQDLQNKYSIPEDDSDLDDAFKFVEDIRDKYLKENEDEWSIQRYNKCFIKCDWY